MTKREKNVRSAKCNLKSAQSIWNGLSMCVRWCLNVYHWICAHETKADRSSSSSSTLAHIYARILFASIQRQNDDVLCALKMCAYVFHIHSPYFCYESTSDRLYVRFSFFPNERSAVWVSVKWLWTSFALIYDWVVALVIEVEIFVAHINYKKKKHFEFQ